MSLLRTLPDSLMRLCFVGVLDGGIRGSAGGGALKWPCEVMPFDSPPERVVRDVVEGSGNEFRDVSGLDAMRFNMAVEGAMTAEHHDWLHEFSRISCLSMESVVQAAVRVLVSGSRRQDLETWVRKFESKFEPRFVGGLGRTGAAGMVGR